MQRIRSVPRLGRARAALAAVCVLAAFALLATAAAPAGGDDLVREARSLQDKYAADIEKLAEWCRRQGLTAEARQTRAARVPQDPYKLFLPILPQAVGPPPGPPEDAPAAVAEWHGRLRKLRQEQAAAAVRPGPPGHPHAASPRWPTNSCWRRSAQNPDHEGARRVFGYQKYHDQWHTAYEVQQAPRRHGLAREVRLAAARATSRATSRASGSPAAAGSSPRPTPGCTPPSAPAGRSRPSTTCIRTNHSIEAAVALGVKLENLNRLWQQMFIRYYASEAYVDALFSGRARPRAPSRRASTWSTSATATSTTAPCSRRCPTSASRWASTVAKDRTAYFFAGGEDTERVMYHEATHQLFQQSRPRAARRGPPGQLLDRRRHRHVHGVAAPGGRLLRAGRAGRRAAWSAARYHLLQAGLLRALRRSCTAWAWSDLQSHPKIAKLYSQMAAMTHFLVYYDGGRYRDALVAYLIGRLQRQPGPRHSWPS